MPVIVPFYQANGMNVQDIMVLQSLFSLSVLLQELPAGYIGDVLGRRKSILIGCIFVFLGFLTYCFSYGFWQFLVGSLLLSVGASFLSGSDTAMLYDTLLQLQRSDEYLQKEGRVSAIGNFSEAAAGILGGLVAIYSLRATYYVQTIVSLIGIFAAYGLVEPARSQSFKNNKIWSNIMATLRFVLVENVALRWLVLFAGTIGGTTLMMAWLAQPYFQFVEIPLVYFGILWTALNLTVGLASWFAHRLDKHLSYHNLLIVISLAVLGGYIGTGLVGYSSLPSILGIGFIFLLYIGRGLASPIIRQFINAETSSDMRATVLSFYSFLFRLAFVILAPIIGWLTEVYSISQALLLSGSFFALGSLMWLILFFKVRSKG